MTLGESLSLLRENGWQEGHSQFPEALGGSGQRGRPQSEGLPWAQPASPAGSQESYSMPQFPHAILPFLLCWAGRAGARAQGRGSIQGHHPGGRHLHCAVLAPSPAGHRTVMPGLNGLCTWGNLRTLPEPNGQNPMASTAVSGGISPLHMSPLQGMNRSCRRSQTASEAGTQCGELHL